MSHQNYQDNADDCGIYAITCAISGRRYIGSATRVSVRLREHRSRLRRGIHTSLLQDDWNAYGEEAFTFGLLERVPGHTLRLVEQMWINQYQPAYNVRTQASGMEGLPVRSTSRFMRHWPPDPSGESLCTHCEQPVRDHAPALVDADEVVLLRIHLACLSSAAETAEQGDEDCEDRSEQLARTLSERAQRKREVRGPIASSASAQSNEQSKTGNLLEEPCPPDCVIRHEVLPGGLHITKHFHPDLERELAALRIILGLPPTPSTKRNSQP